MTKKGTPVTVEYPEPYKGLPDVADKVRYTELMLERHMDRLDSGFAILYSLKGISPGEAYEAAARVFDHFQGTFDLFSHTPHDLNRAMEQTEGDERFHEIRRIVTADRTLARVMMVLIEEHSYRCPHRGRNERD